ncbi:MAG: transposase [Beduini sp.]
MKKLELSPMLKEVLNERLLQYEALCDKIERYSEKLNELSHNESYEKPVSLLCCFKGIDTTAAMTLHIEISDFNRFSSAKKFSSYVGLTPGEDSSGDKTKYLSIMKQGNMTVRSTLIECAQSIVKGTVGKKSKAVKSRQKGQNGVVIAYADRAVERLQRKYHKMIYRGVNKNKAITAVARELACFVCGMEIGHIN